MPKPLFLRRPSGLYVRFFVPANVRPQIGRRFLVRPLHVHQPDQARLSATFMGAALSGVFEAMRQGIPVDIEEALKAARVAGRRDWSAARVVLPSGIILEGVEGTEREALALFHGVDPNDDVANIGRLTLDEIRQRTQDQQEKEAGPKFSERAAVFLNDMKRAGLSYGNLESTRDTLGIFQSVVGDKPLKAITKDDVRLFLDAVADWPTNASKAAEFNGMTPKEVLAAAQGRDLPRLASRSQKKHRENIGKFFNSMVMDDLLDKAPHKNIKRPPKAEQEEITRHPFSDAELALIFDPDRFVAWATKPHRWWGVYLLYAMGARVNEIAQLYVDDVAVIDGHAGIHIWKPRKDMKLKNPNSSRFLPFPTAALNAGILDYVEDVRAAGHERLFPHLPWSKKAGYGDQLTDQFLTYVQKRCGITDALKGVHCFRHNMLTFLTHRTGITAHTANEISGHGLKDPNGLGHYVHPSTVSNQLEAFDFYGPPSHLLKYNPGRFNDSLKAAHELPAKWAASAERRRERSQARLTP